ncbi:MAG TPA: succinyldiaminopimelate transaminase [Gammaproteobacteria bacterium]|nr:succinyldiaminopimelate transaminase [Gammaproteobacteria bacterium]
MNPGIGLLQPYPFEKLTRLKAQVRPPRGLTHIALSVGEPRHQTPALIQTTLSSNLSGLANYPLIRGSQLLRESIAAWVCRRFNLPGDSINPDRHVLPVNGTREALFAIAQCVIDSSRDSLVLVPNPFYQIYEGAALLSGAKPYYLNCESKHKFLPNLDAVRAADWERCQLLYLCTPSNPSGAVMDEAALQRVIALAERYNFTIACDECYAEVYADENAPPAGLLGAAARVGNMAYRHCLVFHSLSKRSNAPGLRSGFVAGDARLIEQFARYRTYHGCAMPPPIQAASVAAWRDEAHVVENRRLYREKFEAVTRILSPVLDIERPAGGFYLWPRTPINDQDFARELYGQQNVTVLPGSFLSRESDGHDPGHRRVRIALVAAFDKCKEAAERIKTYCKTL